MKFFFLLTRPVLEEIPVPSNWWYALSALNSSYGILNSYEVPEKVTDA